MCSSDLPKSKVLNLSKEPTKIVLRPSMFEEPGEHGKKVFEGKKDENERCKPVMSL